MTASSFPDLEAYARAAGHPARTQLGVVWIDVGRFTTLAYPSMRALTLSKRELQAVLRRTGRWAILANTTFPTGHEASVFVVRDKAYGLHSLQQQFRRHVQRHADRCEVRPLGWAELAVHGWQVNRNALARIGYRSSVLVDPVRWAALCGEAERCGFEAWGCWCAGQLAAYITVLTTGGVAEGYLMNWDDRHRELRPACALYHGFTRALISRPEVTAVTVGRQALPAHPGVDRFKVHAGYREEKVPLAVVLHPAVERWLPWRALARGCLGWYDRFGGPAALANAEVLAAAARMDYAGFPSDVAAGR